MWSTPSACLTTKEIVSSPLHTSKPLSRLVNALFKPLVADEIFLSTALIKERCSSKSAARSSKPVSTSGLRAADALASVLGGSGLLRDDTLVSPASRTREAGGVSLSIISGGRSPEDDPC